MINHLSVAKFTIWFWQLYGSDLCLYIELTCGQHMFRGLESFQAANKTDRSLGVRLTNNGYAAWGVLISMATTVPRKTHICRNAQRLKHTNPQSFHLGAAEMVSRQRRGRPRAARILSPIPPTSCTNSFSNSASRDT